MIMDKQRSLHHKSMRVQKIYRVFLILIILTGNVYGKQLWSGSSQIKTKEHFFQFSSLPLVLKYGKITGVKVVYDLKNNTTHFVNGKVYKFHVDYCKKALDWNGNYTKFNAYNYYPNPKQEFLLANLNYSEDLDIYALEISSVNEMTAKQLATLFNSIKRNFFAPKKLKLISDCDQLKDLLLIAPKTPLISSSELFKHQKFQPLNPTISIGYLKFVETENVMNGSITSSDIMVVNGSPNILPVTSGIITTDLQSPLSHITILGINRKVAVFSLISAWTDKRLRAFENELVLIEVKQEGFTIRAASLDELEQFKSKKNIKIRLRKNVNDKQLIPIEKLDHLSVNKVGGKAANFGELASITLKGQAKTPEGAFAIPFGFYEHHINASGANILIDSLLENPNKKTELLKAIRFTIKSFPLNKGVDSMITHQILSTVGQRKMRFRSSTNAEDLQDFNGAGLYHSTSGIPNSTKKPIDKAVKKVWASLWLERAYDERQYFNIEQKNITMGILVHRAFPDEMANGVAISKNLYRPNYPGFTISVQKGEESVVNPKKGVICDHFIGYIKNDLEHSNKELMIDWISKSSINNNNAVLTHGQALLLLKVIREIKRHYFSLDVYSERNYSNFGLDIEFKFEKDNTLYIKQVRYLNN